MLGVARFGFKVGKWARPIPAYIYNYIYIYNEYRVMIKEYEYEPALPRNLPYHPISFSSPGSVPGYR